MEQWQAIVAGVLSVFAVAGIGLGARRLNWLTEEADQSLMKLIVNVLMPCLIFNIILGNERLKVASNIILPPLVGFGTITGGMLIALLAARWLGRRAGMISSVEQRTFGMATGMYNYGYIPLTLIPFLYPGDGAQAAQTTGVLLVHNVGVEIAMWTVGPILLTGGLRPGWWRRLINGPTLAITLAVTINLLGLDVYVPASLAGIIAMLGGCAIPMGLILVGATIADFFRMELVRGRGGATMALGIALRLMVLPVLFLLLARVLPASDELRTVIVVQAAMPAAVFPLVLARHYQGDPSTALRVILATSLLSLLTIPLWLGLGLWFVDLIPAV